MIKNIYYLLILILFISCKQKEPDEFFKSLDFKLNTQSLDLKDLPPPPAISIVKIVLPINDNGKKYEIVTENLYGKKIYEENYKNEFASYPEFLEELSKGNFYIHAYLLNKFFYSKINKNDSIFIEYRIKGFNFILNRYTHKQASEKWKEYYILLFADLPVERENSLLSIMYKQKYYIWLDDYAGQYAFYKHKK